MMRTARIVEAAEAKEIGLIALVSPAGDLDELVKAFTGDLLANSWFTNAESKKLLHQTEALSLAQGLEYEQVSHPGRAPDWRERVGQFRKS